MNLYVHTPFCDGKCAYCALYSVVGGGGALARYPALPSREAVMRGISGDPATVYFGGGSPAVLGADGLAALVGSLRDVAGIDCAKAGEWTVELAPNHATPELLAALKRLGVTRLSFGVQSFDDAVLAKMGRRHDSAMVEAAFANARRAGFGDIGLDLIAGLADCWGDSLERALSLEPVHMSVYALTLEPASMLGRLAERGKFAMPSDDLLMDLIAQAEDRLARGGFERYEISNYARTGYRCRHNGAVWAGEDYAGLGPAAASRIGRTRRTNAPNAARYVDDVADGREPATSNLAEVSEIEDAAERCIYSLRTSNGLNPAECARRFPVLSQVAGQWEGKLRSLPEFAERREDGTFVLTRRGREVCDSVLAELD